MFKILAVGPSGALAAEGPTRVRTVLTVCMCVMVQEQLSASATSSVQRQR